MNIQEFLKYDFHRFGADKNKETSEYTYKCEIREVAENPFHMPIKGENVTHWELVINVLKHDHLYDDEGDNETYLMTETSPLLFKMTRYSKPPTIEEFSKHIYDEMRAVILAFGLENEYVWEFSGKERNDITPDVVWKFLKNIHKDYSKTEDFLKDFDFYQERIYHNWKWGITYLMLGNSWMFAMGWDYPIGEHFLAFLDVGKYSDYYEMKPA
jgi:hypothetical protein